MPVTFTREKKPYLPLLATLFCQLLNLLSNGISKSVSCSLMDFSVFSTRDLPLVSIHFPLLFLKGVRQEKVEFVNEFRQSIRFSVELQIKCIVAIDSSGSTPCSDCLQKNEYKTDMPENAKYENSKECDTTKSPISRRDYVCVFLCFQAYFH